MSDVHVRHDFYPRSPCGERRAARFTPTASRNFYPRSPCGERLSTSIIGFSGRVFLSTLSLRRATVNGDVLSSCFVNFYPRSPCGERRPNPVSIVIAIIISIHALLAESDNLRVVDGSKSSIISIHALLAESDVTVLGIQHKVGISIHALLAESDHSAPVPRRPDANISIHALLAESDNHGQQGPAKSADFYPRSPCGERPLGVLGGRLWHGISIHALLAESDILKSMSVMVISISIHALLAESDKVVIPGPPIMIPISIHALLAESDWGPRWIKCHLPRFLSTLSLRRATRLGLLGWLRVLISIHALLAESDFRGWTLNINGPIFLSTLSLRRATQVFQRIAKPFRISIHALLAESDRSNQSIISQANNFYPRSPCGERHPGGPRPPAPPRHFYPRSPCGERPVSY